MTRGGKDGAVSGKFSSSFYVDNNITKRSFLSEIVHCSENLTWIGKVAINEKLWLTLLRHLCSLKSYIITTVKITFWHELHVQSFGHEPIVPWFWLTRTARAIVPARAHRTMVLVDIPIDLIICARVMFHIFWEIFFLSEKLLHTLWRLWGV